ncbi:MAG: MG2 domain-containing protein [Elusimicrobia bacterium]|nr:MG2 domain-containing protein [Elusimicrobiota bacterium]
MKKIFEMLRKPVFVVLMHFLIFALVIKFASWSTSVTILQLFEKYWWVFILGFSIFDSLIRLILLKKKPYWITIASIFLISYLLLFQSKIIAFGKPTLYYVMVFWILMSLFVCIIILDGFITLMKILLGLPVLRIFKKPAVFLILSLSALVYLSHILYPNITYQFVQFFNTHWIAIAIIIPVISAYLRKNNYTKQAEYLKGIAIFFLSYCLCNIIPINRILANWIMSIWIKIFGPNSITTLFAMKAASKFGASALLSLYTFLQSFTRALNSGFTNISWILFTSCWIHIYLEEIKLSLLSVFTKSPKNQTEKKGILFKTALFVGKNVDLIGKGIVKLTVRTTSKLKLYIKPIIKVAVIIALILLGRWLGIKIYERYVVTVTEFSPEGQIPQKSIIRVTFSDAIKPKIDDLSQLNCFIIEPPITGDYNVESDRTIVFVPREPLKPSTKYDVRLDSKNLQSLKMKRVQSGKKIKFNTEMFKVTNVNLFYLYDLAKNVEKQVMGEINFNYPVNMETLITKMKFFQDSKPVTFELEKSNLQTRFYFKTGIIQREDKEQEVKLVIEKGLSCTGGTVPIEEDFIRNMKLPEKEKFNVSQIKLWHEPGNTFITVLFNMPVSKQQIEKSISVSPPVTYNIETEYCYAVLKGDFKPNVGYKIEVSAGAISKTGEILAKTSKEYITISDLPSSAKFSHEGKILPLDGEMNIEVKTINLDHVNVSVQKIFRNNLIQFLNNEYYTPMSTHVYSGSYAVEGGMINEEVTQYINLRKLHNAPYKGFFKIDINDTKNYWNRDTRWFLCTDLGIIAKRSGDDLIVYVLSIKNLKPIIDAKLQLISSTNQVMEEKRTSESGKVVFENWSKNPNGFYPYFIIVEKGDDWSFMKFDDTQMNQHQFQIAGEPYTKEGMEAFVTPERDLYRPGEKAYITAIVRNKDFSTPPELPVRLIVTDPQGSEFNRIEKRWNQNGMVSFEVEFPVSALTGHYSANLFRIDKNESIGSTSFKVEEFLPDKLKVEIVPDKTAIESGAMLVFSVFGKQMFGPPAPGNKLVTSVRFIPRVFSHASFTGYIFSDNSRRFTEETQKLGESNLDENGTKKYEIEVPPIRPPSALTAYIYTEVFDSGGRPVSAAIQVPVNSYPYYLGAKTEKKPVHLVKEDIKVDYVAIDSSGKLQNLKNIQILVKRKLWYSIFRFSSWGRGEYQSSTYEEVVLQKVVDIDGKGSFSFTPDVVGEYYIYIGNEDSMCTGFSVNVVGTGYQAWGMETPEKLDISVDKATYNTGEQAVVNIRAPFNGKLFLTVEREKVLYTQIVNITDNKAQVSIPVNVEYLPNVYIVGLLVRTPDEKNKTLPMVSFGIIPLNISKVSKTITLDWDCKTEVESKDGIDVKIKVSGEPGKTNVVLAAVDQGILQITNFKTPDPLEYFYRKKSLTTQSYSLFDMILPDVKANKLAVGGDGVEFSRRHLNPIVAKKPKSFAEYSGILTPDENGEVKHHFVTKGFNGEVRVMVMAVNGNKYCSSDKNITVADSIVLLANFPRFIAPSDQFQIPIQIYNKTGKSGNFKTTIKAEGPVELTAGSENTVFLNNKQEKKIVFMARAKNNAGLAKFSVTTTGADCSANYETELSVRPFAHLETVVKQGKLKPGQNTEIKVPADFISYGQRLRLTFSSNPLIQYLRCLDYLIGYPYGCTEQITSQMFPLLYFKELGLATGRFAKQANSVDMYVQEGIKKLEKAQLSDGSFTMWQGGSSYSLWLSLYASHFLIEANRLGYKVNPTVIGRIYSFINRLNVVPQNEGRLDRRQFNVDQEINVYMLYLKTLTRSPDRESMSFLLNNRIKTLDEVDRSLLSLSYSEIGDRNTASRILVPDFKSIFLYREQFGSFNSPIRNTAMYLSAIAQADPQSPKVNDIIRYLGENMKNGHFGNTQEDAWVFISLGKAFQSLDYDIQTQILVNGAQYKIIEGKTDTVNDNSLSGKNITLKNICAKDSYYHFIAEGTPLKKSEKDSFNGLEVNRKYYDKSGKEINLSNVVQGELVVISLSVKPKETVHNLVIVDLLPAGFEIENSRLQSHGDLDFEPELSLSPACQDIRDDRILIFADEISGKQTFSYTVRAVTPGRFTIPNIYAEAMYDPDINGEEYQKDYLVIVPNN